jgi:hypothetical protein
MTEDPRRPVPLTGEAEIEERLSRLDPRDCGFVVHEVTDQALARSVLLRLPVRARLIAAAAAGPVLWSAIRGSFGYDPPAWRVAEYFQDPFPPEEPIPGIPPYLLESVREIAQGAPGDPVVHGLFPSRVTKLARLALARQRAYPAEVVLRAAERAYGRDRGHADRSYHAHDAFACALVHPLADTADLVERHVGRIGGHRGWRSRRKTNRLLAWARRHGHLPDPSACPCGHDRLAVPGTVRRALALAEHWSTAQPLLEVVERDPGRWLGLVRCTRCGRFWAEDCISSGHAELFFGYPIKVDEPADWFARAVPLDLRPW